MKEHSHDLIESSCSNGEEEQKGIEMPSIGSEKRKQLYAESFLQSKDPVSIISSQKSPALPFSSEDYCADSLNQLNVAFIADDSKLPFSDSQSVASDGLSISGISVIRRDSRKMSSPMINIRLEEQFSGLEDWSVEQSISFFKRNLKRSNPSIDEEQNEQQIQNRCTKRKMNDKMKVLTVSQTVKVQQKATHQGGYMLRSRMKAPIASESSSNQQLREMLKDIEQHENGSMQLKNKLRLK